MNHTPPDRNPDAQPTDLAAVRDEIDRIDVEIHELLNRRARAALKVAEIKKAAAGEQTINFYRPEREAQILREVARRNDGPLDDASVQRIFREIISVSLALEQPMVIAYLGPEGTYSQTAVDRHFGHAVVPQPEATIPDIFAAVESGRARFGVVPIENSTEGAINQTLDLLTETLLKVCGEIDLRIQHCILSRAASLDDIRAVHAHPQALAQCRRWLDTHMPKVERVAESSNAVAAQIAAENPAVAAIAGESAAERYGLNVLQPGIQDEKNNTTRFIVIGNQEVPPSGDDCSMLLIGAPHKPGGLRRLLEPMESEGVNLTRIESRPFRTALWEYVFFIDVTGHKDDDRLGPVLEKLADVAPMVRVLGSFPRAL
ncbi:MAG: prephenate dehydratase [Gammaproteobacteria bacterium]|nr:MAG: prephenate dehydratase [Gammaproteobacteria bacterium]